MLPTPPKTKLPLPLIDPVIAKVPLSDLIVVAPPRIRLLARVLLPVRFSIAPLPKPLLPSAVAFVPIPVTVIGSELLPTVIVPAPL